MIHFDHFSDYLRFAGAREFVSRNSVLPFPYAKNRLERAGELLSAPLLQPVDFVLRQIRNPVFVVAVTISALFLTTLLYYPAIVTSVISIAPWMKLGTYILLESAILGLGLRTFGRLENQELMHAWDAQSLYSVPLGAIFA